MNENDKKMEPASQQNKTSKNRPRKRIKTETPQKPQAEVIGLDTGHRKPGNDGKPHVRDQKSFGKDKTTESQLQKSFQLEQAVPKRSRNKKNAQDTLPVIKEEEVVLIKNFSARKAFTKKASNSHHRPEELVIDHVIEQWYTDPFNRYNPEKATGKAARKEVLITALRFRGYRVHSIVNWLIRCNGRYKNFEETRRPSGRRARAHNGRDNPNRKRKPNTLRDTPSSQKARIDCDTSDTLAVKEGRGEEEQEVGSDDENDLESDLQRSSAYLSPRSTPANINTEQIDDDLNSTSLFNATASDDETDEDDFLDPETEVALQKLHTELARTNTTSAFYSHHDPGTLAYKDDYDDWRLEELKRTVSFWNIIYGDDLDPPAQSTKSTDKPERKNEDKTEVEEDDTGTVKFTYFRDPNGLATPDVTYRSQGLKPLERVMLDGKEIWTEDENFGLYVPPKA